MNFRNWLVVGLLVLSIVDLTLTFFYIKQYKSWQPNKPYKMIENNSLLVFLYERLGFYIGSFVGVVVILTLVYLVGRYSHWGVALFLGIVLCWAMYNHFHNFGLLYQLIEKYPLGSLPVETFGKVIGSN